MPERLDLTADGIAALVHRLLSDGVGGWNMGVQGALAEFTVVPGPVEVRREGRRVEAVTALGGLRIDVIEETEGWAVLDGDRLVDLYLTVPRRVLPTPTPGVTIRPGDPGALRPEDGTDTLVDLAVGHGAASFAVRTGDPGLLAELRGAEGLGWREALDRVGHAVVGASPHRVVTTALGRIEVYAPIPREWGASPEGPHTHLLPALLESGREVAEGVDLPYGLAVGANCTNPGWARSFTLVKLPPT